MEKLMMFILVTILLILTHPISANYQSKIFPSMRGRLLVYGYLRARITSTCMKYLRASGSKFLA